jgi:hypothetical protein
MTANQRRPGFRLPWSSEEDGTMPEGEPSTAAETVTPSDGAPAPAPIAVEAPAAPEAAAAAPARETPAAPVEPAAAPAPAPAAAEAAPEGGDEFMRDLVAAMRAVADEARQVGVTELKATADEQVKTLEAEAERRRDDLRKAADADIAGVGEWAAAEADRIKREAEQKVISRKARLDQEMAADAGRTEAESKAVRDRVADYERELEAYHAQLAEIKDPAAFAAAAKRLPRPPALGGSAAAAPAAASAPAPAEPAAVTEQPAAEPASNGVATDVEATNEVLATRLAELDATLPDAPSAEAEATDEPETAVEAAPATESAPATEAAASTEAPAAPAAPVAESAPPAAEAAPTASANAEPAVTEVVVKGLGSFGAITGFRQSLSGVDGIESVALSLGQTGEFVFRATHTPGFDLKAAITALEGDGAKIEARPEGGWRVTLERAR